MPALTLQNSPGFADLDSAVLEQDEPAFGLHMQQISDNAAFGMVELEVFQGFYHHGENVPLPVSGVDGYIYTRAECLYLWHVAYSTNPQSNWITGPDSLWFTNWNVDQATGDVFSKSGTAAAETTCSSRSRTMAFCKSSPSRSGAALL